MVHDARFTGEGWIIRYTEICADRLSRTRSATTLTKAMRKTRRVVTCQVNDNH